MIEVKKYEHISDSELITRILNGEQSLYEVIIRRYNPYLFKIGRSYGYNQQDTEDLIQDSFISAFNSLQQFREDASLKTWMVKIMLNYCYHKRRKFSFKNELPTENLEKKNTTPMFTINNSHTGKVVMNNELKEVLENAILQISEDYRMVFTLRELNGMSVRETSEALQISESNVKVRLKRAKGMLRNEIRKIYSPEEIFEFNLIYCNRIVLNVFRALDIEPARENNFFFRDFRNKLIGWFSRPKGRA